MRVMYICGMYVPSHGGAEISMYSLLKRLKEKFKWEVIVVTDSRYERIRNNQLFNKIQIKTVHHSKRSEEIEKNILGFKPNVIITQLMWGDVALKLAKKHKIPSIIRVCKVPLELNLSKNSNYSPTAIIATSKYIKDYAKKKWDREVQIINPLIETKDYIITDNDFNPLNNELIFMFNPLARKGGEIFKKIAQQLNDKKFGTVYGWSSLKDNSNFSNFSRKYIKRITESEGSLFDGLLPNYINFEGAPNIKILKPENDAKIIYRKIRLLLIPSQWEEAFGRVAIEAMKNGIPVIASNVAGLRDSVGKGGMLVEKDSVEQWVKEILKFDDPLYYKKMSKRAKYWVKKNYSENNIVNQNVNLIKRITQN
jgi:glycosyltransferase involved in cell wall biosynthesis